MINDLEKITVDFEDEYNYFLCANTSYGFKSYFDTVLDKYTNRILIKGGPGTGKSTFLKKIIEKAKSDGLVTHNIYCSSDPYSLDAVLIPKLSLAVVDSTAPHIINPEYPGLFDKIFDLGAFWDEEILSKNANNIVKLIKEKEYEYSITYTLLSSLCSYRCAYYSLIEKCINKSEIDYLISYLTVNDMPEDNPKYEIRITDATSTKGTVHFNSFEKIKSTHFNIKDKYDIGVFILNRLFKKLENENVGMIYSPDVLDNSIINELNIPSLGKTFLINGKSEASNIIDTGRYIIRDRYNENKDTIKRMKKEIIRIYNEAEYHLFEISKLHTALEEIYSKAMDFDKKEKAQNELIDKII